ncbi:hypothetical protein [Caldimonas mangrovi]|nr:hypothetical protein [Caldimonas mangrovi]
MPPATRGGVMRVFGLCLAPFAVLCEHTRTSLDVDRPASAGAD